MKRLRHPALLILFVLGCSTSKADAGPTGGAVPGPSDAHCVNKPAQVINPASCSLTADAGAPGVDQPYSPMHNAEGDDDDCKYHVRWSATDIRKDHDVTFTLTVTRKADMQPATNGAPTYIEAFLSDVHPLPNSQQKTTEASPGIYVIGPIHFDAAGDWTLRFHFFSTCGELSADSPHAHAAFLLHVP